MSGPLKSVIGSVGGELEGRKVALCVTGSVAAVKSPELARKLMRHGADVYPVMSKDAQEIIHPNLLHWATGNPVVTSLTGASEHLQLAGNWEGKVDLVLVAPSTANTISKIVNGIDDTPVTIVVSCAIGSKIPVLVAPAMHEPMYENPFVMESLRKLEEAGIEIIQPVLEEGKAKMASEDAILEAVVSKLSARDMGDLKVLVSAGPTLEYIDPVRVISNRSSGKMGVAIALEAKRRGAEVVLVYGPGSARPPVGVRVVQVETTDQMHEAVASELKRSKVDLFFSAAAAADFAPLDPAESKIPSRYVSELTLKLKPTSKILPLGKILSPSTVVVAFKAEHAEGFDPSKSAEELFESSGCDFVAVNDVSRTDIGFGSDFNEIYLVNRDGAHSKIARASKADIARQLIDAVLVSLRKQGSKLVQPSGSRGRG